MALKLDGWSLNSFDQLMKNGYVIKRYFDDPRYFCDFPDGTRKHYKSLHSAVLSINKHIEKGVI